MKERPIIFSGFSVMSILAETKTQTRRVVKHQTVTPDSNLLCPHGKPGDRLWVRESFCHEADERTGLRPTEQTTSSILYRADPGSADVVKCDGDGFTEYRKDGTVARPWKSSLYMPRWASRITLEVTGVRLERLQDITEDDAKAEGATLDPVKVKLNGELADFYPMNHRIAFSVHWDSINGEKHPWTSNPWVWVVEFKRLEACR